MRYSAAIPRASTEEALAREFLQYLRSAPARKVLAYYGFSGI
ncbi:MAG: substrate-binding domain-containing protein [Casimicrobiaceae bacterium]